ETTTPACAGIRAGRAGGWQRPVKVSLGLLPSGPDPVGEEHVRANLPRRISAIAARIARVGSGPKSRVGGTADPFALCDRQKVTPMRYAPFSPLRYAIPVVLLAAGAMAFVPGDNSERAAS